MEGVYLFYASGNVEEKNVRWKATMSSMSMHFVKSRLSSRQVVFDGMCFCFFYTLAVELRVK